MAMQANTKQSFGRRWENYQPSKTLLFWACVVAISATVIVGFSWGGWVTGGSARTMATTAADEARGQLGSDICVERFNAAPDAATKLVELKAITDTNKKRQFVEAGGWATMPGQKDADRRAAQGCATALTA